MARIDLKALTIVAAGSLAAVALTWLGLVWQSSGNSALSEFARFHLFMLLGVAIGVSAMASYPFQSRLVRAVSVGLYLMVLWFSALFTTVLYGCGLGICK